MTDRSACTFMESLQINTTVRELCLGGNDISHDVLQNIGRLILWNYGGSLTLDKVRNMSQESRDYFVLILMVVGECLYCTDFHWYIVSFMGVGDVERW